MDGEKPIKKKEQIWRKENLNLDILLDNETIKKVEKRLWICKERKKRSRTENVKWEQYQMEKKTKICETFER